MNTKICYLCNEPITGKGYQQWLGHYYCEDCLSRIKDKAAKLHEIVQGVCFMHQPNTCPLQSTHTNESYCWDSCEHWHCGHVWGAEMKIIDLFCKKGDKDNEN